MLRVLTNRVAIVTGGSRGIGSGICVELAKAGARIALNYTSNEKEATRVAHEIQASGGEVKIYQADVGNKQQVDQMVDQVAKDFGSIDILVNNAGICPFEDFFQITEEVWERTLKVNLSGMFFTCQSAGQYMRDQGKGAIINISTVTTMRGGVQQVHYASSKGGVNSLTISMANAVREYGIRVNAILCGGVPTDINLEQRRAILAKNPDAFSIPENSVAIRSMGRPDDLGKACVFLASDASEWVTGALIPIDGGALAR
jgi:NAD(P)-dependent dehydrogenase (short-subunit alcohol dehydrogenase family)